MATLTVDASGSARNADFEARAPDGPLRFERIVKIVVSKIVPDIFETSGKGAVLISIDGGSQKYGLLRVKINFRRPLVWTPCIGTVQIYNLAPDTRALLGETNARVVIFTGYKATGLKQLGIISAAQINSTREGTDWITKIEGGDGGRQSWHSRVNMTFAPKTPLSNIIGKLAAKTGLRMGQATQRTMATMGAAKKYDNGGSFFGNAVDELRYVCKEAGLDFFIADETIYVVPHDGNIGNLYTVDASSGLIGSPAYAAPPHPGKPKLIRWTQLNTPELLQGSRIDLNAKYHKGIYKVRELTHDCDTWDTPWYTKCEGMAQKQAF